MECVDAADRKEKDFASRSNHIDANRSGCAAVADQSLHSNGRQYQIDFERSRCDRRSAVAVERVRTIAQPRAISRDHIIASRRSRIASVKFLNQIGHRNYAHFALLVRHAQMQARTQSWRNEREIYSSSKYNRSIFASRIRCSGKGRPGITREGETAKTGGEGEGS